MRSRGGVLTRGAAALTMVAGAGVAVGAGETISSPEPVYATDFVNDYPDMDATDCSAEFGIYSWCKGDPQTWLSPRAYGYRNCTDGASYWANKYVGVDPRGLEDGNDWDDKAPGKGYAVKAGNSNDIEPGDIAQDDGGDFGHVGFVTDVIKNSDGVVTSIKVAELNKSANGGYSHDTYANRNAVGKFIRNSSGADWDNFIDLNGAGLGINGEVLSSGGSPSSPSIVRVPVAANFDGIHGEDLLASVKRSDGAPNLYTFPSLGGWLGGSALWSAPGQINWSEARLSAGDMNGDGKTDLFAVQQQADKHPNIYWIRSQGSSFAAPQLVGVPNLWFNDVKEWVSGDYNGDGYGDLLAVSRRSDAAPNLVVFPSLGGWLGTSNLWGAPGELNWEDVKVVPADVDNDGKTDLLSIQPDVADRPNIYWSRSLGNSFAPPQLVGVPGLNFDNINNWVAGNFDGQNGMDLLASSKRSDSAPNLLVFPSLGGWLGGNSLWGAPGQINWANAKMVPADVNGDGKTDLLSIQSNGTNPAIYWSRSLGSSFATPQLVGVPGMVPGNVRWQS